MIQVYTKQEVDSLIARKVASAFKVLAEQLRAEMLDGKIPPGMLNEVTDDTPIPLLPLQKRTAMLLTTRIGLATVGQLCDLTERELLKYRQLGRRAIEEVEGALAVYGRTLKMERSV